MLKNEHGMIIHDNTINSLSCIACESLSKASVQVLSSGQRVPVTARKPTMGQKLNRTGKQRGQRLCWNGVVAVVGRAKKKEKKRTCSR